MTDTPVGGTDEPSEPTPPDHLEPPATAEAPTVEAPAAPGATEEVPVAAAVATAPTAPRRRGVLVPWWALAVVAALVVFGGGFLIGHAVSDNGNGDRAVRADNPFGGNGSSVPNPFTGNGDGNRVPNPFGGNDGNGSGNGNGASNTSTAFLGVGVTDSTDPAGVRVTTVVASGPASDAGLRQDDVITAIDGKSVANAAALRTAVAAHQTGDEVKVAYTRDGTTKTVTVSLGDRTALSQ